MDEGQYQDKVHDLDKAVSVLQERANSADKAVVVALTDLGRRLDEMNQFRAQINLERNTFMTKEIFDAKHNELAGKIDGVAREMNAKIDILDRAKSNLEGRMWMLGAVISIATVILNIAMHYIFK
jgi:hypothetical protein